MKVKNLSGRNQGVLGSHTGGRGLPFRVMLVAGATLELSDEDYNKVESGIKNLVEAGVAEIIEAAETKLTKAEIIAKVLEEADVELKDSLSKPELQEKALKLGVDL